MVMKASTVLTTAVVGLSCVLFAGCRPAATVEPSPSPAVTSTIPKTVPETLQVQADICGKFPVEVISKATGTQVAAPSVNTIESTSGTKRHVCTFFEVDDPANQVAYVNVSYRKENTGDTFQKLWEGQKTSQGEKATPVTGIGTEAFMGVVDDQPVLYVLTPEAQYWIRMGKTTLSAERQTSIVQSIGKSATATPAE